MALFLFLLFPSQQAGSSQPAGREAAEQRAKQRASRQQAEQAKLEQGREPSQQAGRESQPAQASASIMQARRGCWGLRGVPMREAVFR